VARERHHGVTGLRPPGNYFGDDVNHQETHGAERDATVHRLRDDPAARRHDDTVGRDQASAYCRGETDQRENSRIK
jgi:hypothetical protein